MIINAEQIGEDLIPLEKLLGKYKDNLDNPVCAERVLEFLKNEHDVLNRGTFFIKRLVKAIRLISQTDPDAIDGLTEKWYNFALTGINRIEKNGYKDSPNNTDLISHFHSDAGLASRVIFEKNHETLWGERSFQHYLDAGTISYAADPSYSSFSYEKASRVANKLSELSSESRWYWMKKNRKAEMLQAKSATNKAKESSDRVYQITALVAHRCLGKTLRSLTEQYASEMSYAIDFCRCTLTGLDHAEQVSPEDAIDFLWVSQSALQKIFRLFKSDPVITYYETEFTKAADTWNLYMKENNIKDFSEISMTSRFYEQN